MRSSVYSVICMVDAAYSVSKWGDMRGGICREVEAILHVLNLINSGALPDNKVVICSDSQRSCLVFDVF